MFNLTRYFSLTSSVGIVVVLVALSFLYSNMAIKTFMEDETRANVKLTKAFSNTIWPKHEGFLRSLEGAEKSTILSDPGYQLLYDDVYKMMNGLNVVKVKIYNLSGDTIFSTSELDLAINKTESHGFQSAKRGKVASEITFKDEVYGLEGVISKRNIIASYLPIREFDLNNGEKIVGVFELYSDVTELLDNINNTQWSIVFIVLGILLLYHLFLFLVVKNAENILNENDSILRQNDKKVRFHAYHDNLTGLKNRTSFIEFMNSLIETCGQSQESFGLMYLDVDRFKVVNDSLGHNAGDELISIVAKRIERSLKEKDFLFRLGGDEFVVIVKNLDQSEDVAAVAKRILGVMDNAVSLKEYKIYVNVSIGIAIYPKDGNSTETLIKNADAAMYQVKNSGGNNFSYYTESANVQALNRLELESGLQRAIRNKEFFLEYQPKISVENEKLLGVEALLRWQHPEKGVIPPNKFIYLLEQTGLINQVGEWVLETACMKLKEWNDKFNPALRLSVNISGTQFKSGTLVETVKKVVDRTGINSANLDLELTETLLIDNIETAIQTMYQLKALGISISIDDFGSGYSSLNYLKQFPIDYLKIDKTFISELDVDEKDAAITTAITVLAQNLSLGVVAEGVETQEQLDFIKKTGCEEAQGFYFSGPVSSQEIEEIIKAPPANVIDVRTGRK